jgi:hypothetical protein
VRVWLGFAIGEVLVDMNLLTLKLVALPDEHLHARAVALAIGVGGIGGAWVGLETGPWAKRKRAERRARREARRG